MSGIIQYVCFCVWIIPLNSVFKVHSYYRRYQSCTPFKGWIIFHCIYCHLLPSSHLLMGLWVVSHLWAVLNGGAMNISIQVSVSVAVFHFEGYIFISTIAGTQGKPKFTFLRTYYFPQGPHHFTFWQAISNFSTSSWPLFVFLVFFFFGQQPPCSVQSRISLWFWYVFL